MSYYHTQGFIKGKKKIIGSLLVKAKSYEEAQEKLYIYGKENADIVDLAEITKSEMWAGKREDIKKPDNLVEISDGVFMFVNEQNARLWQWLGMKPKGNLAKDLNLCFEVFSLKLGMDKEVNRIKIIFVRYEEGFFDNGTIWHCMGSVEDEGVSFMEGYGFNPAMAFSDAMEDFIAGGEKIGR